MWLQPFDFRNPALLCLSIKKPSQTGSCSSSRNLSTLIRLNKTWWFVTFLNGLFQYITPPVLGEQTGQSRCIWEDDLDIKVKAICRNRGSQMEGETVDTLYEESQCWHYVSPLWCIWCWGENPRSPACQEISTNWALHTVKYNLCSLIGVFIPSLTLLPTLWWQRSGMKAWD